MEPRWLMESLDPQGNSLVVRFDFKESKYPFLLSVSSLLYDLELAHDLSVILTYPEYKDYNFSQYFWFRTGRPLTPFHQLRAVSITKHSPLGLEVVVGAVGALWVLIQIIDKVANWKLNKQKTVLEVEKLKKEIALRDLEIIQKTGELERQLEHRQARQVFDQLVKRLDQSPIVLVNMEVHQPKGTDTHDKVDA